MSDVRFFRDSDRPVGTVGSSHAHLSAGRRVVNEVEPDSWWRRLLIGLCCGLIGIVAVACALTLLCSLGWLGYIILRWLFTQMARGGDGAVVAGTIALCAFGFAALGAFDEAIR